ncbi:MAG TPA: SDR family oxidoreductase [Bryobacteraceae bacterium]|nr:SDR family oxidoreductase [Bryobacteraceae bacterium]
MRLGGEIAVITGGAGGIGAAVCRRFRAEGARVAGLDLRISALADLPIVCDLQKPEEIAAAAARITAELGTPGVIVHSAAVTELADTMSADPGQFARIMNANVWSVAALAQQFAPAMRTRRHGAFVLVSSITGIVGAPGMSSYSASKGALITLTRTLALELASDRIRVNCVCPASVDTPMLQAAFDRQPDPAMARELNIRRHPLGRLGTPDDVANLILFLASSEASWITGATYVIDGGASIARRWQE